VIHLLTLSDLCITLAKPSAFPTSSALRLAQLSAQANHERMERIYVDSEDTPAQPDAIRFYEVALRDDPWLWEAWRGICDFGKRGSGREMGWTGANPEQADTHRHSRRSVMNISTSRSSHSRPTFSPAYAISQNSVIQPSKRMPDPHPRHHLQQNTHQTHHPPRPPLSDG
jgi:hypothetical protein